MHTISGQSGLRTSLRSLLSMLSPFVALPLMWRSRYRQRCHLARLDARLLDDIGVTELEARHEATKPFWRE